MHSITAHMQHCKMQMCSIAPKALRAYQDGMGKAANLDPAKQAAIEAVSRWRDAILVRKGWKPNRWAKEAGISPTTITRSMAVDSTTSTKVETLDALARAAGLPSVLEMLEAQTEGRDDTKLNEAVLLSTFSVLLASVGIDPVEDGRAQKLAMQFPNVLRRIEALHDEAQGEAPPSGEGLFSADADRPSN